VSSKQIKDATEETKYEAVYIGLVGLPVLQGKENNDRAYSEIPSKC